MNHSGDANKMVETPRTDAAYFKPGATMYDLAGEMKRVERELNAANERIKRLEEAIQERDKEWFQVIESILGFHPVSMTEALHVGIERIKKQKQRIKRLEREVELLRLYGNKDCTAQADEVLKKEAKP